MREYKISLLFAVFISLTERPVMGGIMLSGIFFFFDKTDDLSNTTNLVFFPTITLTIFIIIYTYKNRLLITKSEIISISLFSTKKLKIDEIKGYREVRTDTDLPLIGNRIFIEPNNSYKKRLSIPGTLNDSDEILDWLSQRFPDLNKEESKQDLKD